MAASNCSTSLKGAPFLPSQGRTIKQYITARLTTRTSTSSPLDANAILRYTSGRPQKDRRRHARVIRVVIASKTLAAASFASAFAMASQPFSSSFPRRPEPGLSSFKGLLSLRSHAFFRLLFFQVRRFCFSLKPEP